LIPIEEQVDRQKKHTRIVLWPRLNVAKMRKNSEEVMPPCARSRLTRRGDQKLGRLGADRAALRLVNPGSVRHFGPYVGCRLPAG
jgi:hypothetical protein